MPIVFTYQKRDEDGNIYYEDANGNRIVKELELTSEEQYYVDTTPEDWERHRQNVREYHAKNAEQRQLKASPFVLNKLDKPEPAQPRYPLWGDYWAEREFCIMAGDTGVGKSLTAIQIGKFLAGGLVLGNTESVGRPRKLLYIDFELHSEGFWLRYGDDECTDNFFWAGFNAHSSMPQTIESQTTWLLNNLEAHIEETGAEVLIIDQIDRLQIPIGKRTDFMFKLKALTRKHKLSTLLTLNTRARNFSKGVELHHVEHSKLYLPFADSVVAIAADYNYETDRYIKPLKMRNRTLNLRAEVQCFSIYDEDEKLFLSLTAMRPEEDLLKKGKAKLKQEQMLKAEALRRDGMTYEYIADDLLLPVSTIKRWVSCIKPKLRPDGSNPLHIPKVSPARGEETVQEDWFIRSKSEVKKIIPYILEGNDNNIKELPIST